VPKNDAIVHSNPLIPSSSEAISHCYFWVRQLGAALVLGDFVPALKQWLGNYSIGSQARS